MAEEPKDVAEKKEGQSTTDAGPVQPIPSQVSTVQEEPSQGLPAQTEGERHSTTSPLYRAGTLPTAPRRHVSVGQIDANRPRGRTISARPQNLLDCELSPRSRVFKKSSVRPENNEGSPGLNSIPERHRSGARRPRGSTNSEREPRFSFSSAGLRARTGTWATVSPRGIQRRPMVLLAAPQAMATGRDDRPINFTLAGPAPMESVAANQPYVDPGYSDLNPAYDQPVNSRPVWGLAKPLPRVIRPGMVPRRSELKIQIPEAEQRRQDADADIEQGRVEPILKLGRVTTQLQNAREDGMLVLKRERD